MAGYKGEKAVAKVFGRVYAEERGSVKRQRQATTEERLDAARCEVAASAAFPPSKNILQPGENSWERKQQKREAAVAACKRSEEYHTWERMLVPLHDVCEELDPTDPCIPKRAWEKQVRQWRNDIRLAAGVLFSI